MQSQSVMSHAGQDLLSMDKSDVSKNLFGQIQWEEIMRSGVFLEHRDHQLLERAQENLGVIVDNPTDSKSLCTKLMKIAENCTSNLTVQQYAFTRIEEILGLGSDYADTDTDAFGSKHAPLFTSDGVNLIDAPFLRALSQQDNYLLRSASVGYACLLTVCEGNVTKLIEWINSQLSNTANNRWEIALPSLSMLARRESARQQFVASGGVNHVVGILRKIGANGNAQLIYEITFILWTLSLGPDADLRAFLGAGTIVALVDLISSAPSRKVVRMSVGTLKNLAAGEDDDVLTEMYTSNLEKLLDNMIQSNAAKLSGDPEFEHDVKALSDVLTTNYRDLSTFDKWESQIKIGALRWGIVHTEKFWRENAKFVEANDFKLLRSLIALLRSDDVTIQSIALYDLGEFTRFYPNGRGVVNSLGGKEIALQLISSENPEIQRQALQCISKIMVTNWEFMR